LVTFHKVLISTAIVFCAVFALWALGHYLAFRRPDMLALATTFGVLALALGYYLRHLKRFLGRS